jgi:hypothetical protein
MIEFIYAVGKTVFGILTVLVTVVLTLALGFGILAGLGAVLGPIWGSFVNVLATRGQR